MTFSRQENHISLRQLLSRGVGQPTAQKVTINCSIKLPYPSYSLLLTMSHGTSQKKPPLRIPPHDPNKMSFRHSPPTLCKSFFVSKRIPRMPEQTIPLYHLILYFFFPSSDVRARPPLSSRPDVFSWGGRGLRTLSRAHNFGRIGFFFHLVRSTLPPSIYVNVKSPELLYPFF